MASSYPFNTPRAQFGTASVTKPLPFAALSWCLAGKHEQRGQDSPYNGQSAAERRVHGLRVDPCHGDGESRESAYHASDKGLNPGVRLKSQLQVAQADGPDEAKEEEKRRRPCC